MRLSDHLEGAVKRQASRPHRSQATSDRDIGRPNQGLCTLSSQFFREGSFPLPLVPRSEPPARCAAQAPSAGPGTLRPVPAFHGAGGTQEKDTRWGPSPRSLPCSGPSCISVKTCILESWKRGNLLLRGVPSILSRLDELEEPFSSGARTPDGTSRPWCGGRAWAPESRPWPTGSPFCSNLFSC